MQLPFRLGWGAVQQPQLEAPPRGDPGGEEPLSPLRPARQRIWNHIHLVYGGTYRYVPVCTVLYRLVLLWCTYWYVLLVKLRMAVHTGT
jgi:hypothetical protein